MSDTRYVVPGHDRSITDSVPSFFPIAQTHPKVVITEKENGTEVVADLKGYRAEDIQLSHTEGQLYIQASSSHKSADAQPDFYELLSVDGSLDWTKAEANFEGEQLIVFIPRDETKQSLKESIPITVKRGDR